MRASVETRLERGSIPEPNSGCLLWCATIDKMGYGVVKVGGRRRKAHRIAWELAKGAPGVLHVLHKCDVPACINPDHLFLGTHADNMRDMVAKGRQARGAKNNSKLRDATVLAIRAAAGSQRQIAARFDISQRHVCNIKLGQRWAHLVGAAR